MIGNPKSILYDYIHDFPSTKKKPYKEIQGDIDECMAFFLGFTKLYIVYLMTYWFANIFIIF